MSGPIVVMWAPICSPAGPRTVTAPGETVTVSPVIRVIVLLVDGLAEVVGAVAGRATAGAGGVTASAVTAATMSGADLPMKERVTWYLDSIRDLKCP
ncbi:hypothetical protein ACTI_66980 [Actinoplanes sp. OR16]|nr:hypothetical protein ACTI_66980 [Actinoplanes sp. OR16]